VNVNTLPFQYSIRGDHLAESSGEELAATHEDRDRELEDYLGELASAADSGTPGPAGPQGPVGATGPPGPTGATGSQGPQGSQGATGATGSQGPPGATGAAGVVQAVVAGTNITVNNTDPTRPIVSSTVPARPTNVAWGIIGYGTLAAGNPTLANGQSLATISYTSVPSRTYRMSLFIRAVEASSYSTFNFGLQRNGAVHPFSFWFELSLPYTFLHVPFVFATDATNANTWDFVMGGQSGAVPKFYTDNGSYIMVEDIGPG
jgi:hypothetical protein